MTTEFKTPGQIACEAYCEFLNAKSSWKDLPPGICNAWEAAARAVYAKPQIKIVQLVSHRDELYGLCSDGDMVILGTSTPGILKGVKTRPELL